MSTFQPAFEVTHVDSMQWNRTAMITGDGDAEGPQSTVDPLPADVLERVRAAVKSETTHAHQ